MGDDLRFNIGRSLVAIFAMAHEDCIVGGMLAR